MRTTNTSLLPDNVKPVKYKLTLKPDLVHLIFDGEASIDITVSEPTNQIVMNAVDLEVQSATFSGVGVRDSAAEICIDETHETLTLNFGQNIPIGEAQLVIKFTGELNDKMRGFYRGSYVTRKGEQRYLATTQFEPTDARRAFPCWDEPACKAKFQVNLVVPTDLVALSNTACIEEVRVNSGLKTICFAETPVMSTYLLAFIVGDLTSIEESTANGTKIAVWTTRGKEEQGRFALDTCVRLLDFFNDYFGIPYPLQKLDHIAIPDFASGAMENWGAITYRETALLVDPVSSSAATRQRVAEVVAHEMAHMWFGDLVTMLWWDDLWLNESFASWMGNKAVDWLFPEWDMWTQFVNLDTARALSLDGLRNSHPIQQEVNNPAEVSQLFDAISYSKGAAVIRMLEQFLGSETFRLGLQKYMSTYAYGNARTQDLWVALEKVSGQPVMAMMDTWTKQMGYPVVQVISKRASGHVDLTLHQERFVYEHIIEQAEEVSPIWQVPIGIIRSDTQQPTFLKLDVPKDELRLEGVSKDEWFKFNSEQVGLFRVNYDEEEWERLVPVVAAQGFGAADRLGIQNDAYAMSQAGRLSIIRFLSLAGAYVNEPDATVWLDLSGNLRNLDRLLANELYYERFRAFARRLFRPSAQKIGWEARSGEGHLDSLLRATVLGQAGSYGDEEILNQAKERFGRFVRDESAVHPDLRSVVFGLAAQTGNRDTYDQLWELEQRVVRQEEKIRLLIALTRFSQVELLQETLERSISEDVRSQDTVTVVSSVAANHAGRDIAWQFVKSNWPEFDRRYGRGGFGLSRLVSICANFTELSKMTDIENFFKEHPAEAAERTIRQALEQIRLSSTWLEHNRQELAHWFRD